MSALGQKQTFSDVRPMSALPPKADIGTQSGNVRFVPKADSCTATKRPLFDQDGMVTVLYRCPNTGFRVQGYPAEDESVDHDGHVPVTCLVCKLMHFVNPKTGEVLAQTRPPTE